MRGLQVILNLILKAAVQEAVVMYGDRKYVRDLFWTESSLPTPVPLESLGYTPAKLKQLRRSYWNPGDIADAKAVLTKRKSSTHTAVSVSMRGERKRDDSQGWCLQNIVISRANGTTSASVFYRTVEVVKKFSADIYLFRDVFAALEVEPKPVTFHFANAYVDSCFFPLVFRHTDGVAFLEQIRQGDPRFWRISLQWISRMLDPARHSTYNAYQKQIDVAQTLDRAALDVYLLKHLPEHSQRLAGRRLKRVDGKFVPVPQRTGDRAGTGSVICSDHLDHDGDD